MFCFVVLFTTLLATVSASYYNNGGGLVGSTYNNGGGGGGLLLGNSGSTYGNGGLLSYGANTGTIPAAILSRRDVRYIDVPSISAPALPVSIEVGSPSTSPLNMWFLSRSSDINLRSAHLGSRGSLKKTSSVDEPQVLVHTVTRPVVQELREVITPLRKVKQEIEPVQEQVQTLVSRGLGGNSGAIGIGSGLSSLGGGLSLSGNSRNLYNPTRPGTYLPALPPPPPVYDSYNTNNNKQYSTGSNY